MKKYNVTIPVNVKDAIDILNYYGVGKGLILVSAEFLPIAIKRVFGDESEINISKVDEHMFTLSIGDKLNVFYKLKETNLDGYQYKVEDVIAA